MSTPNVTWAGTQADRKSSEFIAMGNGVTDYVEIWTGNPASNLWPNYAIGANCTAAVNLGVSTGNLVWYKIQVEQGNNKALGTYTATASDKFDDDNAIWTLEYEQVYVTYWDSDTSSVKSGWFGLPILTKITKHPLTDPPTATNVYSAESYPTAPFTVDFPSVPMTGWAATKTADNIGEDSDGFTRTQQWRTLKAVNA